MALASIAVVSDPRAGADNPYAELRTGPTASIRGRYARRPAYRSNSGDDRLRKSVRDKVVLVPLGPKPQVLAAAVVAARHDHVTLLAPHLEGGGMRDRISPIELFGEVVGTLLEKAAPSHRAAALDLRDPRSAN